jgi:hypothetical protein
MRRPDRAGLIGLPSAAAENASLDAGASVHYLPRGNGCMGLRDSSRAAAAVGDPRSDPMATAVWMALLVRRMLLELELANLQRERSRLVLENQLYRSLLHTGSAATQRG